MDNQLGGLIESEVARAESDLKEARSRGQAVLTMSGALVTLLGVVVAVAIGKDQQLDESSLASASTAVALLGFVSATVFVLFIFAPSGVDAASSSDLAEYADKHWADEGWDRQAAIVLATYLASLRETNARHNKWLRAAIIAEILGIAAAALLTMSLLAQG